MAGAGYKLFNTGDVLTAAQVNEYLMQQTVMVFADATARTTALSGVLAEGMISYLKDTNAVERYDGATWSAIGDGDIQGVTAGTGISGGGTSGTVTITNSMATAIDAKGDLIAGTGADTFSRLAVGSNNTVLTADSSTATGLKWASAGSSKSWTLLNAGGTTLTGAQTVTVSGISGKEDILVIVINAIANASSYQYIRPNGIAGSYVLAGHRFSFPSTYSAGNYDGYGTTTEIGILLARQENSTSVGVDGSAHITGGTSTGNKSFWSVGCARAGSSQDAYAFNGIVTASAAITSISIYSDSGNFTSGTVYVYGA